MKRMVAVLVALIGVVAQAAQVGDDVVAAFARAAKGGPLRYVAIGGSITQASGDGWAGEWLREQFPGSDVTVVNSGMSATGSSLGVFRIERDVIAHQPDLVAIEYCVNDGGMTDEQTIRYMETMVVRLKSLPRPPAIMILEAATRHGVTLDRHRKVAKHYGLLEVDFQAAVDERMAPGKGVLVQGEDRGAFGDWSAIFSDNVHPHKGGNALYADAMKKALAPLVARAKTGETGAVRAELPPPLSTKPLLLDAKMVPLQGHVSAGWKTEPSLPRWWNRFFQGVLVAAEPGTELRIPFRGTTVGLFYELNKDHGSFFANVDGSLPCHVFTNTRDGYGSINVGIDLPAREHVLTVVLPAKNEADPRMNGPVKLGYLLVAGETGASRETSPQGPFTAAVMRDLVFAAMPAKSWSWAGPFPAGAGIDGREALTTKFMPEPGDAEFETTTTHWKPVSTEGATVDVRKLAGDEKPSVAYARTEFDAGAGGEALLSVTVDYYAQLWLNGERVLVFDGPHARPFFMSATLKPGINQFFLKTASGGDGHSFELSVARPPAKR